ncbi:MAG: c-type cytochrome [Sandaracinaceae bacterium]|nr:c-type cytochrome [Myxococcales bacterium]MCB9661971.1 c-type cytochrome [Sandaracinaceae bacterium]
MSVPLPHPARAAERLVLRRAARSRTLMASPLLLGLALGLGACDDRPAEPTVEREKTRPPESALFARYCALCHGERGEGGAADHAPALTTEAYLQLASDAFLMGSIQRGHPGTPMSAFSNAAGGPLSDDDIRAIIAFLRAFQHGPSFAVGDPARNVPVDRARVERARPVFHAQCASCHGERGEGRTAPTLNNPVFHELASDEFLRRTITNGRAPTAMAGFAGTLTPTQIDDLVHFLRSLAQPNTAAATAHAGEAEDWASREGEQLVLNPDGRPPRFAPANAYVQALQVKQALDQRRRMILFDARAVSDWRAAHLPGALPAPYYADDEALQRIPDDGTQIVVYCGCPHAAADRLAARLREAGYRRVAVIDEGFFFWSEQGYPLEHEPSGAEQPPEPEPSTAD